MRNMQLIRELKRGERVNVKIAPMCIFLFRDGTVISIHRDTHLNFTQPISERLRQRDTGLRSTADPSLLVESLIDLGLYSLSLRVYGFSDICRAYSRGLRSRGGRRVPKQDLVA